MKHLVLIIDGASGWPAADLGGFTSLEAAHIPNLDRMAREGKVGLVSNVPVGLEASSAIACMSVMGFDPTLYYSGRGPIEAAAMGIELEPRQVAMRCNLVTVLDGRMASYSAGNISSAEAYELIAALQDGLRDERVRFYPGVGYRHILTVRDGEDLVATAFTPPHDIAGRPVDGAAPVGPGAAFALDLMERSKAILERASREPTAARDGQTAGHPDLAVLAGHAAGRRCRRSPTSTMVASRRSARPWIS